MYKYSHSTQGFLSSWKNRGVLRTMSMTHNEAFWEAKTVKCFHSFTIFGKRRRHRCLEASKYTPEEIYLRETREISYWRLQRMINLDFLFGQKNSINLLINHFTPSAAVEAINILGSISFSWILLCFKKHCEDLFSMPKKCCNSSLRKICQNYPGRDISRRNTQRLF